MSRDANVDNRKHGPATTKEQASTPVSWRSAIGEWCPPGQATVTDTSDDPMEEIAQTGPLSGK